MNETGTVSRDITAASRKERFLNFLRIFISLLLLFFIFLKNYNNFSEIYSALINISILFIIFAILSHLIMIWVESLMWDVLLRALDVRINRGYLSIAMMVAYFYNSILPSNIGGDFFRIYDLSKNKNAPLSKCASAVFMTRFFGLITITIFFAATAYSIYAMLKNYLIVISVFLGIAFILFIMLARPQVFRIDRIFKKFKKIERFWYKIENFSNSVASYKNRFSCLAAALGLNIASQLMYTFMFYFISISLGLNISFLTYAFMVPVIFVLIGIPVSIGGLGVRENTIVFMLVNFNISNEKAVAFSMIVLFIHIFNAVLGGVIYFFRNIFYRSRGFI